MNVKTLVILRGIPFTGKSFRANQLLEEAAKNNIQGKIFSTDEYWYKVHVPDKPEEYSFDQRFLGQAHQWNVLRVQRRIDMGDPLLIVDNSNVTAKEFCCNYAKYAHWQNYKICIEEPISPWWLEIRELLKDKNANKEAINKWATKLAEGSKKIHNVPDFVIERMMLRWECDLCPEAVVRNCVECHNGNK